MIMMVDWAVTHSYRRFNSRARHVTCMMELVDENRIFSRVVGTITWCIWEKRPRVGWVIADTEKNRFIGKVANSTQQTKLDKIHQDLLFHKHMEAI